MKLNAKKFALSAAIIMTVLQVTKFIISQVYLLISMNNLDSVPKEMMQGMSPEMLRQLMGQSLSLPLQIKTIIILIFTSFLGTFASIWLFAWLYNKLLDVSSR